MSQKDDNYSNNHGSDEITFKELLLKIQEYWYEILDKKIWVLLIVAVFVAGFLSKAILTPVEYSAPLSFMINEEDGGGVGGIGAIASQFGVNFGAGAGEYNKEKIVALSKSQKIVHQALLDSAVVEGKNDLLANHLIILYELHDYWRKNTLTEKLYNFVFTKSDQTQFDRVANKALKTCYARIIGIGPFKPLFSSGYNEDSGILKINLTCINEELSYALSKNIFKKLSTFYIQQQTEPQQKSLNLIKSKIDSLKGVISQKEYILANLKDTQKNLVLKKFQIQEQKLIREIPSYYAQYAQTLQNMESASFLLSNSTPFFQIIDAPIIPLAIQKESKFKALVFGLIFGIIFATIIFVGRKILLDALKG